MTKKLEREGLVDVAMGYEPADTVIINGQIVNVHTGLIQSDGIAIKGPRIAALGNIGYTIGPETKVIDATGRFLVPGLIDPHTHQWHTYLNSTVHAITRLLHGNTSIAESFYGQAIVNGVKAVRFALDETLATPLKPIFLVPTMCYVQNRALGLPNSPNAPTIEDLFEMLNWPECKGIGETAGDFLVPRERRDREFLRLMEECLRQGKVCTGHSAGIYDDPYLNAWVATGQIDNHATVTLGEAKRQAELGVYVEIREASGLSDVRQCLPLITEHGYSSRAFQTATDVLSPEWTLEKGQIDHVVRTLIKGGLNPIKAIQMSTIQTAESLRVNHDIGIIAAGRFADILFVENLAEFTLSKVMANGQVCVEEGKFTRQLQQPKYPKWMYETMNISRVLKADDFHVPAPSGAGHTVNVRLITVQDGSIKTPESRDTLSVVNGIIEADPGRGINKIAAIDRLHGTGEMGVAFAKGFNIRDGCIGTTANVLSQNILLVGASNKDMAVAANELIKMGGGLIAIRQGKVVASFPMPLHGLETDLPFDEAFKSLNILLQAWRKMGYSLDCPAAHLEFTLPVPLPWLKICTKGLAFCERDRFELVSIVV